MKSIKNLFILLAITLLVSCSNDTENEPTTTTQQFAKVGMNFNPETQQTTGKTVNRGSIYAWINSIRVTATNGNYNKETIFDLVNSGAETNDFIMDNVLVGLNSFIATTTTNTIPKMEFTTFPTTISTADKLTELNNLNPYAIYSGTLTADIALTNNNLSPIDLTTQHGRVISIFALSDNLKNNGYYAKININGLEQIADKNNNVAFYWSDESATKNSTKQIDIILFDKNNVQFPTKQQIRNYITASRSNNTTYTINDNSIHYETVSTTSKFSFQIWNTSNYIEDTSTKSETPRFTRVYNYIDVINYSNLITNVYNVAQYTQIKYQESNFMVFDVNFNQEFYYSGFTDMGNGTLKFANGHIMTVTDTEITDFNPNDNTKTIYHN